MFPFDPDRLRREIGTSRLRQVSYRIYADASGSDDWTVGASPWYVVAYVFVRASHRWKRYRHLHATAGRGHIHLSARGWPASHRDALVKTVLQTRPWDQAMVFLIDRDAYRRSMAAAGIQAAHAHQASEFLQGRLTVCVGAMVTQFVQMGGIHIGADFIRDIVFNHPGRGWRAERDIVSVVSAFWSDLIRVRFAAGGDPGIDLADLLAWSIHRCATTGQDRHLPWSVSEPLTPLGVLVHRITDHGAQAIPQHIESIAQLKQETAGRGDRRS